MTKKPEPVGTLYKKNSVLSKLSERTQRLSKLDDILQQLMPAQFASHCHLANVNEHTLVIHTDNASYASLLRFQAPSLCKAISEHLPQIVNKIEVKVKPKLHSSQKKEVPIQQSLPDDAARALEQTAEYLEDGPLKTALNRLAKRRT